MNKSHYLMGVMLSIGAWGRVLAYDITQSLYLPQGIQVGGFMIYHKLDIGNQYDSNIYKRDKSLGVVGSYIAHFSPGFEIQSNWNQHALNFSFDSDLTQYAAQSVQNNYQDIVMRLDGRLDVVRDSFMDMAFSFSSIHEDRGSPDQIAGSTPTFYDTKNMRGHYTHRFNLLSVDGGMDAIRYDYQDTATSSGTLLKMSTRSRWEYMPSVRIGYEIQSGHEAFVTFSYKKVNYDTLVLANGAGAAFQRDSRGYNILGGMELDLTDLITGSVSVGYLSRTYADAKLPSISGMNGFLNLKWRPTELTTVKASISRDIQETTQSDVSGYLSTALSLSVEHELLRDVLLRAGADYAKNEYQGFDPNNPIPQNRKDRNEDLYGASAGVKYLWNSNISMDFTYRYQSRDVNYLFTNYVVHTVMFNITGQF
ncbi:MAG: outer membrane beta-barrel protein [Gammaproteobacteria bacterium]